MAISPLSPLSLHFLGDDGYSLVTQPHIGFAVVLQTTINRSVHAIGIGVHGASKVRMTLRPAPENTGIVFVRADRGDAAIEAKAHWVCDTLLSTSVGEGDLRVATVEHLMSALWGVGVDNLIVELNGEELPILDGSAAPFVRLVQSVGLRKQSALRRFIRVRRFRRLSGELHVCGGPPGVQPLSQVGVHRFRVGRIRRRGRRRALVWLDGRACCRAGCQSLPGVEP
jgi:hypothetical protein